MPSLPHWPAGLILAGLTTNSDIETGKFAVSSICDAHNGIHKTKDKGGRVNDSPRIADLVAQIAIEGTVNRTAARAPTERVVQNLVNLGFERPNVAAVLRRAIDLGVIHEVENNQLEVKDKASS